MLILVTVCIAVLAYTYVGYPLAIGALARLFPQRIERDPSFTPSVTACIAVYNGAASLNDKIESLLAQDYPADKLEVLIYTDGCTDNTAEMARAWARRNPRVRVIVAPERRGKPSALNRMRDEARGEVLVLTDVRQPLVPGAVRALVSMLADPSVGCVTGNLVLVGSAGSGVYWRYENWIRAQEARFRSVVGITGPLSIIRARDLPPIPTDTILDDVWIPMRLRLAGRKVLLCEEAIAYDRAFEDDREFQRKVRTLAGNYQIFSRMPALLNPLSNKSWFETVSHKILRLVCPWALAGLAVGAIGAALAGSLTPAQVLLVNALLAGQFAFYLAALAGPRLGRFVGVARTFVVLHWAALVGLWRFAARRQSVTW